MRKGWIAAAGWLAASGPLLGAESPRQPQDEELDEVVVFGRGERLIGLAQAASEGTVGGADLGVRPLLRVAELLEAVPGLIAAQHSGSGKANQYFLRGFNLDHGTDFAAAIDGVPLNLRTHGHGQGYLDINGLIPELVERIDFRKGPYRADIGDNALAGASFLTTVQRFERPFLSLEVGDYAWRRIAGGGTIDAGPGQLTVAGQWKGYDGPWELPEKLQHLSGFIKYTAPAGFGQWQASLSTYDADWQPTEQIPERAIGTAICADAFCALDTSATGHTLRHIGTLGLSGEDWRATLYGQYYNWDMFSDSTYDYQIHQWDKRYIYGGRGSKDWQLSGQLKLTAGADARLDDIQRVRVDHTAQRVLIGSLGSHRAREASLAGFAEASWQPVPSLRVMTGLRADTFDFHTRARQPTFLDPGDDAATVPALDGDGSDSIVSPKVALAWELSPQVEAYANWGRGFHSNDSRGVTASDPPVPGLVRGEGEEVGARYQRGSFSITATYWWLQVASELKFVGDSNSVEPGASSRRRGYELVSFWRPLPQLAIDASWTVSRGRYYGPLATPGETHIAGAVESAGELGVAYIHGPWEISGRVRHLGPYPLLEDNSQRAKAEEVVNLRAAWKRGAWMVYGELLNLFDGHGKDIVYWYESYLPAIDAGPTEGRMSRAEEPRSLRLGLRYSF
ncbi:MAG: TonB-dependent receptor [Steroidobacteraceae bacterium]